MLFVDEPLLSHTILCRVALGRLGEHLVNLALLFFADIGLAFSHGTFSYRIETLRRTSV
jgi:hypothetical protein